MLIPVNVCVFKLLFGPWFILSFDPEDIDIASKAFTKVSLPGRKVKPDLPPEPIVFRITSEAAESR